LGADSTVTKFRRIITHHDGHASYYSILLEKPPTQSWRKDQIIAWLQEKRIPTPKGSFKAELLNLANAYKSPRQSLQ
jgi:hypothetical protein